MKTLADTKAGDHASNYRILPEEVETAPTTGDYLPGKIFVATTTKKVQIVVAVAEDGALTLADLGSWT